MVPNYLYNVPANAPLAARSYEGSALKLLPGQRPHHRCQIAYLRAPKRYNRVATDNCRLPNCVSLLGGRGPAEAAHIAITLDAMLACWTAIRMEGENPPDMSVPRLTHTSPPAIISTCTAVAAKDRYLDPPIQQLPYPGNATSRVEITHRTMTNPHVSTLNKVYVLLIKVDCMR
jgi:hypothetical protein